MKKLNETECNGAGELPFTEGEWESIDELSTEDYNTIKKEETKKMATLKEEAMAYEPQLTLNIADLDEAPVNLQIEDREGTNQEGKNFQYKVVILDSKEYRVPNSVLEEIQKIIKLKPTVTKVNVTKSGSGLGTKYKVDALD